MLKIGFITIKIGLKQMYILCRQLSIMISSGINLVSAFQILEKQNNDKKTSKALGTVVKEVQSGESLFVSLEKSKSFSKNFVSMVMIGENSGNLDKVFLELSEYYYKEYKIRQTIKQALAYPIFILIVTIIASIFMAVSILPMICEMIKELEIKSLPLPTKILLNVNSILSNKIFISLIIIIGILIVTLLYMKRENIQKNILFKVPIINIIYRKVAAARFARSFSMLFSSGVPIVEGLKMCEALLGGFYKNHIEDIRVLVESGESLYFSIKNSPVFPEFFSNMIETGEESGRLDFVLNKIGEFYEKEVEFSIKQVTKIFEPSLIIGLSLIVGLLLSAVMLPLFQIYGEV